MNELLARRRSERDEMIALARAYVERLAGRIELTRAFVAGSIARGDFNVWSDIDVVVVAPELPRRAPDRIGLLLDGAPPRLQPIGYTPEEWERELARGNRLVVEAEDLGIEVWPAP